MRERLRGAYGRLRTVPWAGVVASRLVWAAKGALGRPVGLAATQLVPPKARRPETPAPDARLQVALAAIQALSERISALEPARAGQRAAQPESRNGALNTVSVIVSTLDRADWLDRALTALAYQRHRAFEVIVVAGPCRDGTDAVLARHGGRIRTLRCDEANLSAARNKGLAAARGDMVAFLDDDAAPEPDWLDRLCAAYNDPQVGGAGGLIRDRTGLGYQCKVVAADRFGRSAEVGEMRRARLDLPGSEVERYLSLTGANSSFRRQALLDIGGFDEAYVYFLDETDVCLRLCEAGWRLTVVAEAEVHHAYAPNAQRRLDRAPRSLLDCARSATYFALRNAAPRHGLVAAADHLHDYATTLRRDTLWRRDHGVLTEPDAERLLAEIEAGMAQGVALAFEGRRRLLAPNLAERAGVATPVAGAPSVRPDTERLKLCLLSQAYPSAAEVEHPPGGVAVWTQALALAMAAAGHEVTVITRAGGEEPSVSFEAEDGAGVWVHRVGGRLDPGPQRQDEALAALPSSVAEPALAAALEVMRIDARRAFDLVMGPLWDLEPVALFGRAPCPVAVSLHTACAQMSAYKPQWDRNYRRSHVDKVVAGERRLLAQAPHVLSNSFAAAVDIGAALNLPELAARTVVIPHGLPDLARGVSAAMRDDGVEVLFVGRLERRKGIDVLLAAAAEVLAAAPEARLVIVGEDVTAEGEPWREAYPRRHAGASWLARVRFTGPLSRPELLARYAACDLVVAPSRYESFGLTALEAMIFAKPCVASNAGGLAEVVIHDQTGCLVPPDDPAALAAALRRLVRDPALRRRMGAAGRARYEAHFTSAAMAQAMESWVWEAVKHPHRLAAE